jgi:hypothetical protein
MQEASITRQMRRIEDGRSADDGVETERAGTASAAVPLGRPA